jgi:hypothetical protein
MVKKSFAASVVGAPVTVLPEVTIKDVTICVQFTLTSDLSAAPVGKAMVPPDNVPVGVSNSHVSPVDTVTEKSVELGAAYCVANVPGSVRALCMYVVSVVMDALRLSPLLVDHTGIRSPPCSVLIVESWLMLAICLTPDQECRQNRQLKGFAARAGMDRCNSASLCCRHRSEWFHCQAAFQLEAQSLP